jgi:pyruvate-formate lyase-activating enzyme
MSPIDAARIRLLTWKYKAVGILSPPRSEGARLTWKRILNCYLARFEYDRLRTRLRSRPYKLVVEPTTVCNLRCPACYTGDGQIGRPRTHMSLELYHWLLDELGDYLIQIDFCNWGEPLLGRNTVAMLQAAHERGIGTQLSTNFSIPFDDARADALVASGLAVLGVSLDGATQATYETYRIGGNLETVLRNCRMVADAKRRLGSSRPRMVWSYHVFPHNTHEVGMAEAMARELGMDFAPSKGWVVGDDWDPTARWEAPGLDGDTLACTFLWTTAVVNNDGGVSPCCGTFYREDDMDTLAPGADAQDARRFLDVWNGQRFLEARALYRSRTGPAEVRERVCFDCPKTVAWENRQRALAAGVDPRRIPAGYGPNDIFNYFWSRRPEGARQARRGP